MGLEMSVDNILFVNTTLFPADGVAVVRVSNKLFYTISRSVPEILKFR